MSKAKRKTKAGNKSKKSVARKTTASSADPIGNDPTDVFQLDGPFPYEENMKNRPYRETLEKLQIELLHVQSWVKQEGQKIAIIFEGRDAAGKGGTIKRFREHLNPRGARLVAFPPRTIPSGDSGTSSATSTTCPHGAKSCSLTDPGTTGRA